MIPPAYHSLRHAAPPALRRWLVANRARVVALYNEAREVAAAQRLVDEVAEMADGNLARYLIDLPRNGRPVPAAMSREASRRVRAYRDVLAALDLHGLADWYELRSAGRQPWPGGDRTFPLQAWTEEAQARGFATDDLYQTARVMQRVASDAAIEAAERARPKTPTEQAKAQLVDRIEELRAWGAGQPKWVSAMLRLPASDDIARWSGYRTRSDYEEMLKKLNEDAEEAAEFAEKAAAARAPVKAPPAALAPTVDPLVALRREAPPSIGPYGGLAWALSALVKQRTGVDVPRDYWTTTWHWPLASYADKLDVRLDDIAVALLAAERDRAAETKRVAYADLANVLNAERMLDDMAEFPLVAANVADWAERKRGKKTKWADPALAMILHGFVDELKAEMLGSFRDRARRMNLLIRDAQSDLEAYKKTTDDLEKDAEYMTAFRAAVGMPPSPIGDIIARRRERAEVYRDTIGELQKVEKNATTPEHINAVYAHFLEFGHPRAYGKNAEVIDKLRAVLSKPPPEASDKPVAYVYDRYNGELQVWPVRSIKDARALFDLRHKKPGNRDINAIALQGSTVRDAVEVTKQELVSNGKEVLKVTIHPTWGV